MGNICGAPDDQGMHGRADLKAGKDLKLKRKP